MQHIEEKLKSLEEKVDQILGRLPAKKLKLAKGVVVDNGELMRQRKEELLKIFWSLVTLPIEKKEKQSFPREIRQGTPFFDKKSGEMFPAEVPEIVPYSVLKNRCLLRSVFRLREGENSESVLNAVVVATASLETHTLGETGLREGSNVRCVWSKTELHRRKLTIPKEAEPKREPFVKPIYKEPKVDKSEKWGAKMEVKEDEEEEFKLP